MRKQVCVSITMFILVLVSLSAKAEDKIMIKPEHGATPPKQVQSLLQNMFKNSKGSQSVFATEKFRTDQRATLSEFASRVAAQDCPVRAIYGCGSCSNNGNRGNLVVTDCGTQCWTCGGPEW